MALEENPQTSNDPYFAQTPQSLLRSPKISPQAKGTFGLLHTFCCEEKDLQKQCVTYVSLETLEKHLDRHPTHVGRYLKELHEAGWITVVRRGVNLTNLIYLHAERKRR